MLHLNNQKLLQFLMGLNETYSHMRSDILLRIPILNVNQAYVVVVQEESLRKLRITDINRESLSLLDVNRGEVSKPRKITSGRVIGIISGTVCNHCGEELLQAYRLSS